MDTDSSALVIVAHPDDETLWAGGTILEQRTRRWHVASVCRGSDTDRAPKFHRALQCLGASGSMGDVDDAPDQAPLQENALFDAILNIVPPDRFELVITHSPKGEYTRHRRHEETGAAVIKLWRCRKLSCGQLWTFAYDDSEGRHLPRASSEADVVTELSEELWQTKRRIITDIYGFAHTSFEARTTPRTEAFRCFESPADAMLTL